MASKVKLTEAQIKKRIRYLVAHEVRQRLVEFPNYLETEPLELQNAWTKAVEDIAEKICPESRALLASSGKDD